MNGLHPKSPNDYTGLFAVAQLHGYSVFLAPDDSQRPDARTTRRPKRRLRWLSSAGRGRHAPAPAPSGS